MIGAMKAIGAGIGLQGTALFLVVFGSIVTLIGCKYNWAEAKTLGAGVTGAGVQAITSQVRNILNNKDGGTVQLGGGGAAEGGQ